jgi:signal peptidase I
MRTHALLGIPGRRWSAYFGLVALCLLSPVKAGVVRGDSMAPSFHPGQVYAFNPFERAPARGDVVVLQHDGELLLKRVLATAGDTVFLLRWPGDPTAEVVSEAMVGPLERAQRERPHMMAMRIEPLVVPAGHLYVVGDHLLTSEDSRDFGPVPVTAVQGTVLASPPPRPDWLQVAVRHDPAD